MDSLQERHSYNICLITGDHSNRQEAPILCQHSSSMQLEGASYIDHKDLRHFAIASQHLEFPSTMKASPTTSTHADIVDTIKLWLNPPPPHMPMI